MGTGCRFPGSPNDYHREPSIDQKPQEIDHAFSLDLQDSGDGTSSHDGRSDKDGKLIEQWTKAGALLATEGCMPSAKGARVRRVGDKITVIDGPFAETKELVGGFALLQAKSKEEAIELVKTFLKVASDGECELRQLYEPSDFGPENN
jgi:hypothetical protein